MWFSLEEWHRLEWSGALTNLVSGASTDWGTVEVQTGLLEDGEEGEGREEARRREERGEDSRGVEVLGGDGEKHR